MWQSEIVCQRSVCVLLVHARKSERISVIGTPIACSVLAPLREKCVSQASKQHTTPTSTRVRAVGAGEGEADCLLTRCGVGEGEGESEAVVVAAESVTGSGVAGVRATGRRSVGACVGVNVLACVRVLACCCGACVEVWSSITVCSHSYS